MLNCCLQTILSQSGEGVDIYITARQTDVVVGLAGTPYSASSFYVVGFYSRILFAGTEYTAVNVLTNNSWTHIAVTVDEANIPVAYINGLFYLVLP